jgi:hypothetical protein
MSNSSPRWNFRPTRLRAGLGALLCLALVTAPAVAAAAAISGKLQRGGQPLVAAELKLICGAETAVGKSDAQGNYNLTIGASGRCAFSVGDKSVLVVLGRDPARYDFEVPADAAPLVRR